MLTNINSIGDKCIMVVLPICAHLFGQIEGILEKYCVLAQSEVHYWLAF